MSVTCVVLVGRVSATEELVHVYVSIQNWVRFHHVETIGSIQNWHHLHCYILFPRQYKESMKSAHESSFEWTQLASKLGWSVLVVFVCTTLEAPTSTCSNTPWNMLSLVTHPCKGEIDLRKFISLTEAFHFSHSLCEVLNYESFTNSKKGCTNPFPLLCIE